MWLWEYTCCAALWVIGVAALQMNGRTDFHCSCKMHSIMPPQVVCCGGVVFFFSPWKYLMISERYSMERKKSRRIRISQWCNKPSVLSGIKYRTSIVMWEYVSCFVGFLVCLSTELLLLDMGILPKIRVRVPIQSVSPQL